MRRNEGARPHVLTAMGFGDAPKPVAQSVKCPICGTMLDFDTDAIGRLVEFCPNAKCYNAHPHKPVPDAPLLPPSETRVRKKGGQPSYTCEEPEIDGQ